MWRTIGNMGYLYARMEEGRFHGVPVVVIEPGEQWSGFGALAVFNAYPRKNRNLMAAGYRDAKRALVVHARLEAERKAAKRSRRLDPKRAQGPTAAADAPPETTSKIVPLRSQE
jgi:hypothetical protein